MQQGYAGGCRKQQIQGISTTKPLHIPGGLLRGGNTDETKSLENHAQTLNIAGAKILAPGGVLFAKADEEENLKSSQLPGRLHGGDTAPPGAVRTGATQSRRV